ncbi:MAG: GNAT family N-acetyltransferase [Labilithrix sp.]|nr:GNAT family N-acetyltransferase [Labilithrix sp.]
MLGSRAALPSIRTARVADAGIFTLGAEELVIEDADPEVGRAVCLRSGGRLAFRRVLEVHGGELVVRGDVAPFEERWCGEVVGCVRPRVVDRLAAIDPRRWTAANWHAAVATAHLLAARQKLRPRRDVRFTTAVLDADDWPGVRAFWRRACGRELPVGWQTHQHVIGLFDGDGLVGANIQLVAGMTSFSAFTLVDRRYRGLGGGYRMILHAVSLAEVLGVASMYVHVNARNLPSIAAYRKAGFERKGWWSDEADPLASAERQWLVFEREIAPRRPSAA